ncbi:hypothetical protein [Candidatus Pantoea bituminis]|uniref:hypothetical protein n=1 Tax=Candidatus Pantoea bituminis TaxID=2831036 RepID=UPI001C060DF2|nr:hypothetical protein [Pantoea bituminis]
MTFAKNWPVFSVLLYFKDEVKQLDGVFSRQLLFLRTKHRVFNRNFCEQGLSIKRWRITHENLAGMLIRFSVDINPFFAVNSFNPYQRNFVKDSNLAQARIVFTLLIQLTTQRYALKTQRSEIISYGGKSSLLINHCYPGVWTNKINGIFSETFVRIFLFPSHVMQRNRMSLTPIDKFFCRCA